MYQSFSAIDDGTVWWHIDYKVSENRLKLKEKENGRTEFSK